MNRAYRSVWNAVTSTWTAAAETAKSQSKGSARAARQAVVAFALGGAAVGGAAAAEACTTEEGTKGTVDAAGVCTVANGGTIGTTGLIGTMAFDDTTYVKVNSTGAAATASGTNAVAIGGSANSGGTDSTAIGQGATVVSGANNSVALGTSARVTNSNSAAIGSNASVAGSYSNAFGPSATSAGTATIALGGNSTASGNYSVAIGGATTTGRAAVATGTGSIALGTTSSAGATNAVALGFGTVANRDNTVSVGAGVPNIDGSTFTRQIVNVAAGTEDNDAVNVAQMNAGLSTTNASIAATNLTVASLSTGLSTTNSTVAGLSTSLSSTNSAVAGLSTGLSSTNSTVAGLSTGLSSTNSTVAGLSTGLSSTNSTVAGHTKQIGDIDDKLSKLESGTIGLVQQAGAGADLTVGANTDGAAVDFAGKAGDRTLKGVAAGTVSATSDEAVNGSQLHGVADSVASAIGGGSTVNPDGSISAPAFTVGDGSGGTRIVNSVGDVVTNLDGRVTNNETSITQIRNDMSSGSVGLVRQDPASGTIMVATALGGASVNIAGTDGTRRLSGVAKGVDDDDAVTVAQLKATGLIDYTGKEIGAVTYDDGIALDSVTFGGKTGTTLHNIAPGLIAAGSMDGVNGGQLYAMQQEFAKQYGDLSSKVGDLSGRVGDLEAGGGGPGDGSGTPGYGPGMGTGGEGSLVVGGADASGSNGTAVGQGAGASGSNGTAVGQDAIASGENSTALGQGASATGSGSVAIGQGSVATEANTVSFGDGTAEGNRRLVNIADGVNASDAATKGQLDRAMESVDARFNDTNRAINDVAKNAYAGIAAAMAMPNMTPSQPGKTVVAVGAANFKSGSAIAAGATYRSRSGNWLVNGATSITSVGDVGVRAQVGYEF
ncbi:YadA-like family protein [Burkholderia pseudomultivorans]|uniref:YadA-like family protein n=1 Tax=Burkholderia pseudomultivorans TaxID=1207504 RepID=UPI002875071F|nr:YadA-like family protein [Burkholderia pseudomultivorans]MDS0790681.1 YadA-like family protein [Burkholderia pseudomultivorans]